MLKNKKLLKIIALLLILVLSIGMLTGCGDTDKEKEEKEEKAAAYEEPVKNYIEGMEEANAEKFLKAFPEFITEYMKDIFTDEMLEEALVELEDEYGKNLEMNFEIKGKEEVSEDELTEQEEDIKTNYDEEVDITKGYELQIDLTIKGDDSEETDTDTLTVYEIDGKWCIIDL